MSKFSKFAAIFALAGATLLGTASPALAYQGNDLDNASISPVQGEYSDGDVVTLRQSGLKPNTKYVVGQCAWQSYSYLFFNIPACGLENQVSATSDARGNLEVQVQLLQELTNAHRNVAGPALLDSSFIPMELLVVEDHGKGFRGTQVGDTAGTFTVS